MRWSFSLLLGVVNAVFCALASGFAADIGSRWHKVSDMEGGRAMLVVFVFVPLGFLVGLAVGLIAARSKEAATLGAGLTRLGISMGVSVVLVAAALGWAWASADHPPTIDDRPLALEYEMRLPPGFPVRDSLKEQELRVGLVVSSSDRAYTDVDFDHVSRDNGFVVVPGRGYMRSTGMRSISVTYGPFDPQSRASQFVDIPLAPRPTKRDFEWSNWFELNKHADLSEVPAAERAQVRYRVRFADADSTLP